MLARSTAWRHGVGRSSAKATSMSRMRPSRTIRLAGLMSRWARPASHSIRMRWSASSMSASSTIGVAELDRAVEELGHQQVLPLGRELDEAVRLGAGHAGVADDAQRVVLLLHQPTHGVERLLVLQPPVQQLPTELVPAVRAQVGARVELAEQVRRRRALHPEAQRRRAGRAAQPERLDLASRSARAGPRPPCGWPRRARRRRRGGRPAPAGRSPGRPRSGRRSGRRSTAKPTPMRTPTTIALGESTPRWRRAERDQRDDDRDRPTSADCGGCPSGTSV